MIDLFHPKIPKCVGRLVRPFAKVPKEKKLVPRNRIPQRQAKKLTADDWLEKLPASQEGRNRYNESRRKHAAQGKADGAD